MKPVRALWGDREDVRVETVEDAPPPTGLGERAEHVSKHRTVGKTLRSLDAHDAAREERSRAGPLYRQRLTPSTFQPTGPAEQLSVGIESAWLPSAAGGRVAFVSSRADSNLWSLSLDGSTGIAHGSHVA